jgi:hypothetical protein
MNLDSNLVIQEIQQKRAALKEAGICPSCRGTQKLRVTRFPNGTEESRVVAMEPCMICNGTGKYNSSIKDLI